MSERVPWSASSRGEGTGSAGRGGGGGEFVVSELHTHVVIIVPNRWDLLSFSSFL